MQLNARKTISGFGYRSRPQPLWDKTVYHNDKIKIAYLSADFHIHPVAHLIAELFERHDRSRFEDHRRFFLAPTTAAKCALAWQRRSTIFSMCAGEATMKSPAS